MITLRQVLSQTGWSSLASVIFIALQAIAFIIVARFVSTSHLGSFALASSILMMGITVIEQSFTNSLMHSVSPSKQDYNAVLRINILMATVFATSAILISLFIFICKLTPPLTSYLLISLIPCLYLSAYNSIELTGLKINIDFKSIAKIELVSSSFSLAALLISLYLGCDIWSLAAALLVKYISTFILLSLGKNSFSNYRSSVSIPDIIPHWEYGKFIIGEKSISSILSYADVFAVGHFLGLSTLGIYDVMKRIVLRPIVLLYNGVEQLFLPLLNKYQKNQEEYLNVVNKLSWLSKYLFINLALVLYLSAPLFISLLPGTYSQSVSVFKALCLFGCVVVILNPIDILLYSKGLPKLFMKWVLSYTLPYLIVTFYSASVGLEFMLYMISILYLLLFVLSYFVLIKKLNIPSKNYFSTFIYGAVLMGIVVFLDIIF